MLCICLVLHVLYCMLYITEEEEDVEVDVTTVGAIQVFVSR